MMKNLTILTCCICLVSCHSNVFISNDLEIGEEVMIEARDGKTISGSLLKADGAQTPAIVIVVGSGNFSYRSYWEPKSFGIWKLIAESFVKKGYSVLLLEKRGVNKSEGNWKKSNLLDRANDVADAVLFLGEREGIDEKRIGICGHSQGGWVAQLVAANYPDLVDFVILLAGPAVSVKDQVIQDHVSEWKCEQLAMDQLMKKAERKQRSLNGLETISGFIQFNHLGRIIDYDPKETLSKIQCPVLAVYAENDPLVVPKPNISILKEYFPNQHKLEIMVIDSANHFFIPASLCTPWSELKPSFAPAFKELLAEWPFLDE